MSRGVLMHAYNNEQVDYTLIALCNALMIKSHLRVPVCLVTNKSSLEWLRSTHRKVIGAFDRIILYDPEYQSTQHKFGDTPSTSRTLPWHNTTRSNSYSLSPFDETLLIDSDYLVLDKTLSHVWGSNYDVMINRRAIPLNHGQLPLNETWLEQTGIEMCWATCIYFKKSQTAKSLFDMVQHIQKHYDTYSMIYGFHTISYRNDFAFSIAVHMMSGFTHCDDIPSLPSPFLFTSFDCDELIDVPAKDTLKFLVNDRQNINSFTLAKTKDISVHVMNKFSIVRQAEKIIALYGDQI